MNKFKLFIKVIRFIIILPALTIHELSHLIASLLVFIKPTAFVIRHNKFKYSPSGYVDISEMDFRRFEYSFRFFIVLIAPFLSIIAFLLLTLYNPLFIYISAYQLLFLRVSFLSDGDLDKALKILKVKREVRIPRLKFKTAFYNWLYYDGLSYEEFLKQNEMLFLASYENAEHTDEI